MEATIDQRWIESKRLSDRIKADFWKLAKLAYQCQREGHNMLDYADYVGLSPNFITKMIRTWEMYGDPDSRMEGYTFNDHIHLTYAASDDEREEWLKRAESEGIGIHTAKKHIAEDAREDVSYQAGLEAGRQERYQQRAAKPDGDVMEMAIDSVKHARSVLNTARKRANEAFKERTADPIQVRRWITGCTNIVADATGGADTGWEYLRADGHQAQEQQAANG